MVAHRQIYGRFKVTDENPQRPNANYKLSKTDIKPGEHLNFHYNREHRLEKAPKDVKDLYNEQNNRHYNLFSPLVADRPRRFLFGTIIILCVIILIFSATGLFNKNYALEGNKLDIRGTGYEGTAIVVIRKTVNSKNQAYTGAVDIAVSPAAQSETDENPVFYHRIFFTLEPIEEYRFVIPFDSPQIAMVLKKEKNSLKITIKVD
jgi:hypothetical protein